MIKVVKLVTTEEIVGDLTDKGEFYLIEQPCAVIIIPSQSSLSEHRMGLMPYAGYTKGHQIEVRKDKIAWEADPAEELYNQYNKVFGSGIQLF